MPHTPHISSQRMLEEFQGIHSEDGEAEAQKEQEPHPMTSRAKL